MGSTLKVTSLNLWSDQLKKEHRSLLLNSFIEKEEPDVILLQENSLLKPELSVASFIAKSTGYSLVESPEFISPALLYRESALLTGIIDIRDKVDFDLIRTASFNNYAPFIILDRGCHKVMLASLHLPWGPREHLRLQSAYNFNQEIIKILEREAVETAIIGGDFNCKPSSDTIRFLEGELVYNQSSTLWVNSAKTLGCADQTTSNISNLYAQLVARSVGILELDEAKDRTIDYQFTYGYTYGKVGHPVNIKFEPNKIDGQLISDHIGLTVEYRC